LLVEGVVGQEIYAFHALVAVERDFAGNGFVAPEPAENVEFLLPVGGLGIFARGTLA
jgi:hypothetical protein